MAGAKSIVLDTQVGTVTLTIKNIMNEKNITVSQMSRISGLKFDGEACVIAISSTSILSYLLIGKTVDEAKEILINYSNMIEEGEYDKDILGEALVYEDMYKQPSRKTCATLFARGISKIVSEEK